MASRQVVSRIPYICIGLSLSLSLGMALAPCVLLPAAPGASALADPPKPTGSVSITAPAETPTGSPAAQASPSSPGGTPVASAEPPAATTAGTSAPGSASPAAATVDPQAQLKSIFQDIQKSVQRFYPKATFKISPDQMHFEFNCKQEESFYTNRMVLAPNSNGILCDLTLRTGQYQGDDKDRLPSEVQDGFHTNLTMAPYSKNQNKYLLVRMSFPPDIDVGFKQHFEKLVNNFNAQELADEAAAEKAAKVAAKQEKKAAKVAAATELKKEGDAAAAQEALAFGASNLAMRSLPEAHMKAMLPDEYKMEHLIQSGMAKLDYSCQTEQGRIDVACLTMPPVKDDKAALALVDKVLQDLVTSIGGQGVQDAFINLKGYPGKQIMISSLKDKPSKGATMQIYLVNDHIYYVEAVGDNSWLQSPAVNLILSSFEFFDGDGNTWVDSRGLTHWLDAKFVEHWRDGLGHEHYWDANHRDCY